MRTREYTGRNRLRPDQLKNKSRYVAGALHSHSRPAETPLAKEPDDNPETRGLTEKP